MIPKIIHYCWFGRGEMPELVLRCIASWHEHMPDWQYVLWNEDNFDVSSVPYVQEAYAHRKFAFVSDYVRLWALERMGGVYLDVDFEVYKSFAPLLNDSAFAGWQGSKRLPVMLGVLAAVPQHPLIKKMRASYGTRLFVLLNNKCDLTPNTDYFTNIWMANGLVCDGQEKVFEELHIYPVNFFCPRLTNGEYLRNEQTYCEHKGLNSWAVHNSWKTRFLRLLPQKQRILIIKVKRALVG